MSRIGSYLGLALASEVQTEAYLTEVLCPKIKDINCSPWGVPPRLWEKLLKERHSKPLRELAKDYDVSHEAVRRVLRVIDLLNP